jgi:hypothetical protein
MRDRRAVVLGPDTAVLVERRLQSLVAEGWDPIGALGCAYGADGVVIVGVFERDPEAAQRTAPPARAEASRTPPPPVMRTPPRPAREAPEGEIVGPPCPVCAGEMKRRARKVDGKPFWGCASFPECRGIVNWGDWGPMDVAPPPSEATVVGRAVRPALPPAQAALPGFAPAGEAAACWGPAAAEPPAGTAGAWAGDPDDNIPF